MLPLITEDEPRLHRVALAAEVDRFCGRVDEFWAWFPSLDDIVLLGIEPAAAPGIHERYADWDYQLLRRLKGAGAASWPRVCHDLHALARAAGVTPPPNPRAHHPAHDAAWGRSVYRLATSPRGRTP